jgi:hypothetical protein
MGTRVAEEASPPPELKGLRRKIAELVAQNAIPMVQQAIDAVREEGQYQAIKYLFEMIGLYPGAAQVDLPGQESLARTLLEALGLPDAEQEPAANEKPARSKSRPPVR